MRQLIAVFLLFTISQPATAAPTIARVWLSQVSPDTQKVVISWQTDAPGDSIVEWGVTAALGKQVKVDESVEHHQVEVTMPVEHGTWHYRVKSGEQQSAVAEARGWDRDVLKVAIVADIGYTKSPWTDAVLRERPHLLLTAGDNVSQLHERGKLGVKDNIAPYQRLIDLAPELFRSTLFMPVLGNHDREIRPRGPMPPPEPVYDVDATAFRKFFALPGDEWKWHHDLPAFGVRLVAVDLNHVQDHGTTWQTCHDYREDSEQLAWYQKTMAASEQPFVITIYNEKQSVVRGLAKGAWWPHVMKGSAAVTGFGYFAERAMVDDFPCFNTSVSGKGDRYRDPKSVFLASEDNFVLLTFTANRTGRAALKNMNGATLDEVELKPRAK